MTDPARAPLPGDGAGIPDDPPGRGCGVQGCLLAAVGLFVVLLLAMLVIAAIRFSSPPEPRFGMLPPAGPAAQAEAAAAAPAQAAAQAAPVVPHG